MNLLKAQDLLKGVPDKYLEQMRQNPQIGMLVAAEADRRLKVRKEYESELQGKQPQSTVIDDLLNSLGVASLQPPGQQQVPVQVPQMAAAPQEPVQMYDGGIGAFADGGETDMYKYMPQYASNVQIPDLPGFDTFLSQVKDYAGESDLPQYRAEISEERKKLKEEEPTGISSLLKNIGRGLVGSKSTNFISALAEGVGSGITLQEAAEQKHKEAMRQLRASEIDLAQKERAEKMGLYGLAKQYEDSAAQRRNSAINQNQQASQLALTAKHYSDVARDAEETQKIRRKEVGIRAREAESQANYHNALIQKAKLEIANYGKPTTESIVQANRVITDALADARKNIIDDPYYNDKSAEIGKITNPIEKQVAIQRLNLYFRRNIAGIPEALEKLAGYK